MPKLTNKTHLKHVKYTLIKKTRKVKNLTTINKTEYEQCVKERSKYLGFDSLRSVKEMAKSNI